MNGYGSTALPTTPYGPSDHCTMLNNKSTQVMTWAVTGYRAVIQLHGSSDQRLHVQLSPPIPYPSPCTHTYCLPAPIRVPPRVLSTFSTAASTIAVSELIVTSTILLLPALATTELSRGAAAPRSWSVNSLQDVSNVNTYHDHSNSTAVHSHHS